MRLLCVSDIHGRLDALAAVLATAERRSFNKLLVAGDIVFPGPAPLETWRRLVSAGAVMVQGVSDKALATLDPTDLHASNDHEHQMIERMRAARAELGDLILERLKRLPTHVRIPLDDGRELLLVHGSPADPAEAFTHDMSDEEMNALIGDDPADIIVCGMSHVPFDRMVGEVRIVNVGSVGEAPDGISGPKTAIARIPQPLVAHAAWIESTAAGVVVEQITVPLDVAVARVLSASSLS
jgi:predicted phosphodiesterase